MKQFTGNICIALVLVFGIGTLIFHFNRPTESYPDVTNGINLGPQLSNVLTDKQGNQITVTCPYQAITTGSTITCNFYFVDGESLNEKVTITGFNRGVPKVTIGNE